MRSISSERDAMRHIASRFVAVWADHKEALDEQALPYLDSLLDAIIDRKPTDPENLIDELHSMVPGLQRNTARRLVNLKFGNPLRSDTLAG